MTKPKRYQFSTEVRERAVRLVQEQTPHDCSWWAAIGAIAPKLGCTPETLRRWVGEAEDARPSPSEEDWLKVLERENWELRRANEILRKAGWTQPVNATGRGSDQLACRSRGSSRDAHSAWRRPG
jgi:transposase